MDIRLLDVPPTDDERLAVDALLGPPLSQWEGGARDADAEFHHHVGGRATREKRHLLVPALQALQRRVGWISEGGLDYVCRRLQVPPAEAWGVATFYALLATSPRPRRVLHVCDDIACRNAGGRVLCDRLVAEYGPAHAPHHGDHASHGAQLRLDPDRPACAPSPCLGLCDHAPAALLTDAGPQPRELLLGHLTHAMARAALEGGTLPVADASDVAPPRDVAQGRLASRPASHDTPLLARIGRVDPTSLDAYRASGGYAALERAFAIGPEGIIAELTASKLVGRGGAAFPTGRKWEAVRVAPVKPGTPKYIVCNADESEPGTFKDRVLLTGDPFAIVESMTIAALATGATKGFIYVRAEYPLAWDRLVNAIERAREAGLLGSDIMGRGLAFDLEVRRGAGAYICGEETALFESIEGKRGEPRSKPPFPVLVGLFGCPTVVNNVETLANVLPIIIDGGEAYARTGTAGSTGTRLFSVSGAVRNAAVYELPHGATLRELLDLAGGIRPGRTLTAVLLGGAAGTFVRADEVDLRLTNEDARAAAATLGSGVVMAFDDTMDLKDAVLRIAAFFRDESCGQCVPCRVGTVRQEEALTRLARGPVIGSVGRELALLDDVGVAMRDASICGLGQAAYGAVESAIKRLRLYDGATGVTA